MPVEIAWDNADKTILFTTVTGTWTWEEMYAISQQSILMRRSVSHEVGSIVDLREAKGLPADSLSHAKNIIRKQELYATRTVLVGGNFAIVSMWDVLMRVYGFCIKEQQYFLAQSLDEAREILVKSDPVPQ